MLGMHATILIFHKYCRPCWNPYIKVKFNQEGREIILSWIFKCVVVAVAAARGTATNLIAIFKSNWLRVATAIFDL